MFFSFLWKCDNLLRFDLVVYMYISLFESVMFSIWWLLRFVYVKSFHFVHFGVVVIYRVVFCQDVKYSPSMDTSLLAVGFVLLMIYSLFDGRVDVISAKFALWNYWSVIEVRLKQDLYKVGLIMYLVILYKFFVCIDVCFVQFDELYIFVIYLWLRIRLIQVGEICFWISW